jgi:putative peptidoglycan lipid II flippase
MITAQPSLPVSLVIPVRNEASTISETLDGILALSTLPSEIIFVDTGSTDKSVSLIESWSSRAAQMGIRFKLIHHPGGYPGAARNSGVKQATFEWIAFLDVGIKPEADWLSKLWDCMHDNQAQAVYGMCQFSDEHPFGRLICAVSYGQDNCAPVLPASLFHKDVFLKAGYFEEHLRSGEDLLWNKRIFAENIPAVTCRETAVHYQHFPTSLWAAVKKWFIYEQSTTVAGLSNLSKSLMLFAVSLVYVCLALGYSQAILGLVPYFLVRGVLDPFRRAGHKIWWQHWWQPLVIIPVAMLLDAAAIAGRLTAWMGLSKFRLQESSIQKPVKVTAQSLTSRRIGLFLGFAYFSYAMIAAILFQKVLLPWQSQLHAGHGLLVGDSEFFHVAAQQLAETISLYGWSAWKLFPVANAYGNVGINGAIYAFFGVDPAFVIPLNASVHALSGVMLYRIISMVGGDGQDARWAGVISGSLFVLFPTALNWYGQLHKDGYAILGLLFLVWSWLTLFIRSVDLKRYMKVVVMYVVGISLLGVARPYVLKLLIPITILTSLLFFVSVHSVKNHVQTNKKLYKALVIIGFVILNILAIYYFSHLISAWASLEVQSGGENYANWVSLSGWAWQHSAWLPKSLDSYFQTLANTRTALIEYGIDAGAKSMIDTDRLPSDIYGLIAYVPRALQIALFAPFPTTWLKPSSLVHLISTLEMAVIYIGLAGMLFLEWRKRWPQIGLLLLFSGSLLIIYGITTANLGTLYRLRYFPIMLLLGLGMLGWVSLINKYRKPRMQAMNTAPELAQSEEKSAHAKERRAVLSSGVVVLLMTFVGFVGFFFRDLLMASRYGLNADMDIFYLALLLPMFAVSVLSIPAGSAFTPVYLNLISQKSYVKASHFAWDTFKRLSLLLAIACIVLAILTPSILPLFHLAKGLSDTFLLGPMNFVALMILLLSGVIVIGNAILNAHGFYKISTGAQLIVPATSFLFIYFFSDYGVIVAMLGMLAGQVFNLGIVFFYLFKKDFLQDKRSSTERLANERQSLKASYLPIIASALFVSMTIPFSSLLAIQLPEGSVAALNLGTKIVMFITGLIGSVLNVVMLPYFSSLVARERVASAREELSFYIWLSVLISLPLSAFIFMYAKLLCGYLFNVSHLTTTDLESISQVMQFGVLQVPFFICSGLMLKFVIATRYAKLIWFSAIAGMVVHLLLSMLLAHYMGVAGIVLGASIATIFSTMLLLIFLCIKGHISTANGLGLSATWLIFLTLILCLSVKNPLGICFSSLALMVLFFDYFKHQPAKKIKCLA